MRKMFSSAATARKAASKSASVRRKKTPTRATRAAPHEQETDYHARGAFLFATTDVMKPAPIDTLRAVLPVFSLWFAGLRIDQCDSPFEKNFDTLAALMKCRSSQLGDSREAIALKDALGGWMDCCGFRDEWISDYALFTLGYQVTGAADPRSWYFFQRPSATNPQMIFAIRWNPNEPLEEFRKRARLLFQLRMTDYVQGVQFRTGQRKGQLQPARWTARLFNGWSYRRIADAEPPRKGKCIGEDTVRKAVTSFMQRAGLRLPTVGEIVGTPPGKHGKNRAIGGT